MHLPSAGVNRFRFNGFTPCVSQPGSRPPEVRRCLGQRPCRGKRFTGGVLPCRLCVMTEFTIRAAGPDDATALKRCIQAAYAVYDGRIDDLPDVAGGIAEDIRDRSVWVAVQGGRILGGGILVMGEAAHLTNVAVHPDAGGKGIGRALIDRIEAVARQAGYSELRLATHVRIPENVVLYERLGWRQTAREGNKILMAKPL